MQMNSDIEKMLQDIEREVRYTRTMIHRNALHPRVMAAMEKVPRHMFVAPDLLDRAYYDGPLPIGCGQTISQPFIVALMTDLAEVREEDKVLEIGTGSGYQTAILAELVKQVYSMEIIQELGEQARKCLQQLGYTNIKTRIGDGHEGWQDEAPFDAVVVTAAADAIPQRLIEQLKPGGRLIIPVGPAYCHQELIVVEKDDNGKINKWSALGVAFVPLTGGY